MSAPASWNGWLRNGLDLPVDPMEILCIVIRQHVFGEGPGMYIPCVQCEHGLFSSAAVGRRHANPDAHKVVKPRPLVIFKLRDDVVEAIHYCHLRQESQCTGLTNANTERRIMTIFAWGLKDFVAFGRIFNTYENNMKKM